MTKKLYQTRVYLAGNLESSVDSISWRDSLRGELEKRGIIPLDPTQPLFMNQVYETAEDRENLKQQRTDCFYEDVHDYMTEVIRKDLRLIDISDFTIFRLEPTRPTFGTIHELAVASQQRKPILILIKDRSSVPLWIMGLINMDYVFESESELLEFIDSANGGRIELDSKYWKLLKEELR